MNRDAHFYAVLGFCRACGFTKASAQIIAHASQLVDDARINIMFIDQASNDVSANIQHDTVANRPAFFNMATCHSYLRIKSFNYEAMVNNTAAFHFVPGCVGENFTKKLRCKEESPVVLDLLQDVGREDDLIKLGIVLHAYADTFSHQGFSGMLSRVNDIKNCVAKTKADMSLIDRIVNFLKLFGEEKFEQYFDRIMPGYGHCQALEFPDIPHLVWSYRYDCSDQFNGSYKTVEIDNKQRYTRAFINIKKYLELYLINHPQYGDHDLRFDKFDSLLATLVSQGNDRTREKNWQQVLVKLGLFDWQDQDFLTYEENKWLTEAFTNYNCKAFSSRKVDGVQLADNFAQTHWYKFYLAVKWYKQKFFAYCAGYQLSIPN